MAKTFTTGLVITGDAVGGVKALSTVGRGVVDLNQKMVAGGRQTKSYAQEFATGSREAAFFRSGLQSLAGIAASVFAASTLRSQIDFADRLQKLNLRIGAGTEALSQYNYVAGLSGVEFDALATAWQRQTRRISDATQGTGEAVAALDELGLSASDLSRLSPEDQFERIAGALLTIEDPGRRAALAMKLWDTEGVALLQIVNQGTEAIAGMRAEADQFGVTISQQTANDMATFNDEVARFKTALQGASMTLLSDLVPALTESLQGTNAFVREMGGVSAILDDAATVAQVLAGVYAGRLVGSLVAKTTATVQSMAADRAAALQSAQSMAVEQQAIAMNARRAAAEKTSAVTTAALAQQRATAARVEAAAALQSISATQQQMAAERALEAQRLQAQISATGRMQSLTRLAEIRRSEVVLAGQATAAQRTLTAAEAGAAGSTRALAAAKLDLARASKVADAAIISSTLATRAATAAQTAMTVATRGLAASMAFLGGPAGVALLAVGGLYLLHQSMTDNEEQTRALADAVADLSSEYDLNTRKGLEAAKAEELRAQMLQESARATLAAELAQAQARARLSNITNQGRPGGNSAQFATLTDDLAALDLEMEAREARLAEIDKLYAQLESLGPVVGGDDAGGMKAKTESLKKEAQKYLLELERLNAGETQTVENWRADSLAQTQAYYRQGLIDFEQFKFSEVAIAEEARRRLQAIEDKRWSKYTSGGLGQLAADQRDAQAIEGPRGDLVRQGIAQEMAQVTYQGLPSVGGLSSDLGGEFAEVARIQQETDLMREAYQLRIDEYKIYREMEMENAELYDAKIAELEESRRQNEMNAERQMGQMKLQIAANAFGTLADLAKTFAGEQSGIYKALFVAQKGIAIAQTVINTEMAATAALAPPPVGFGPAAGVGYAQAIRGMGYASVAAIAAQTIMGQAHDGIDSIPADGTWNLQKGERVTGAALNQDLTDFLARENRQAAPSGTGGGGVTITQHLTIKTEPGDMSPETLTALRNMVKNTTYEVVATEMRPGGMLGG